MAGFIPKIIDGNSFNLNNIQRNIRKLGSLGIKWDEELIKQSKSVGITEAQEDSLYSFYNQQNSALNDYGQKEFIAFYDKEYKLRRDFLRRFSMNSDIEHVLEIIADETIIYDDNNYFAYPNTRSLKSVLKAEKAKEIVNDLNESFRRVYYSFGFNNSHDAWHYLKKYLIDGFLAFEIIYDEDSSGDAKKVIGFKELDPTSLRPITESDDDSNPIRAWIQYEGDNQKERKLLDSNLIYISWARGNFISRLSYVERLVRSFNMLRTLENSHIIWNIQNSQQRIKIAVPMGTQSEAKMRTRLSELRAMYKEDITINSESGEIAINGQPNFSYGKTYIFPTKDGQGVDISSVKPEGYDMNSTETLKHFWMRFINETNCPVSRFNMGGGENNSKWESGGDQILREELRFSNFINRIRSMFQELLLKPTWIDFCLKHPELSKDNALKSAIGLEYIEENLFTLAKQREIASQGAKIIGELMALKEEGIKADGTIGEIAVFDAKFLVEKYMTFTDLDRDLNEKYKKQRMDQLRRLLTAMKMLNGEGGEGGGMGDMGGGLGDMSGGLGDMGGGLEDTSEI